MGEPLLKIKNGKAIGLVIFLVIIVGIYFLIINEARKNNQEQEEAIAQTEKLPANIRHLLSTPSMNEYKMTFSDMSSKPVNDSLNHSFVKYLYFTDEIYGGSIANTSLDAIYDKRINELLGTSKNLNNNNLDGIIIRSTNSMEVGVYKFKDEKGDEGPALKVYYTLTYIKLPEQIVVKRDTVWGKDPDKQIRASDGHHAGSEPKNEEIVSTIKKSLSQ